MVLNYRQFEKLKKELKSLMGNRFLDPLSWQVNHQQVLSRPERTHIKNFPWSLDLLKSDCPFEHGKKIYETHFLFWGHPVNIPWFARNFPAYNDLGQMFSERNQNELFNWRSLDSFWYLMPIKLYGVVDDWPISSIEHKEMVPLGYDLASAVEETAKQIFIREKTGRFANELILYKTSCEQMIFNPAYKEDRTQAKFVWGTKHFETSRLLLARCFDKTSSKRDVLVSTLDKSGGLRVLSIAEDAGQVVFPLALSLKRKFI